MEEKLLVSLQELKSAIDSGGSIDTGDLSYDSLKTILEFFIEQEKENKKYIIKMTDEQYSRVIELVECDINKKWEYKIKAKIGKRMQKNNNTIHNAKLKHGKDYVYYDDVQEAKEENRICKEILQSLLEK